MIRRPRGLIQSGLLFAFWLGSSSAWGAEPAQARAFLAALYAHYPTPKNSEPFDPANPENRAHVFDPSMVSLLNEDQRLTPDGDVGAIDWDPLCGCQDDDGLTQTEIGPIVPLGRLSARANVRLTFGSDPSVILHLQLVKVDGHWRIHDIRKGRQPRLSTLLIKSNREQKRRKGGD